MKCQEVMMLMQRQLDGDLSNSEYEILQSHLTGCPECTAMSIRLQRLSGELELLPKVVPPYSIVDAILPQLAAMHEPLPALEQNVNSDHASSEQAINPHKVIRFPWRTVSGSAAAAIVLGLLLFPNGLTQFGTSSNKSAESVLDRMASGASELSPKSNDLGGSTINDNATMDAQRKIQEPETEKATENAAPDTSKVDSQPTLGFRDQFGSSFESNQPAATPFETPFMMKIPTAIPTPVPTDISDRRSTAATPAPTTSETISISSSLEKSGGISFDSADSFFMMSPPSAKQKEASIVTPQKAKSEGDVNLKTPSSPMIVAPPAAASGSVSLTDKDQESIVTSPGGSFYADIEQQHVVIRNRAGELFFASQFQWRWDETIQLRNWPDSGRFQYEVITVNGTKEHFQIDLNLKTELKL